MKLKIGVMGSASGQHSKELLEKATAVGKAIAENDAIFFFGATIGLPLAAAKGTKDAGGTVLGVSPALNKKEHLEKYHYPMEACSTVIYTGMGLAGGRNTILVRSYDAIIALGGRVGTMNECSIAYAAGIPIGLLKGSGGMADKAEELEKEVMKGEYPTPIILEEDPKKLVEKLIELLKQEKH